MKRASRELSAAALTGALNATGTGSLFLDGVAFLPVETQLALAGILEQAPRARVLLGSSDNLADAAARGAFHADLHPLSGMVIRIPALPVRRGDIPVLFRHHVAQAADQAGLQQPKVPPGLIADLMRRDWPGNVRTLMSEAMRFALGLNDDPATNPDLGLAEQMAQVEKSIIEHALERADGRAVNAAKALKLPRKTVYHNLARHDVRSETIRTD